MVVCGSQSHQEVPRRNRFGADENARRNPLLSLDKLARVQDGIAKSRPGDRQLLLADDRRIVRTQEPACCDWKLQFLAGSKFAQGEREKLKLVGNGKRLFPNDLKVQRIEIGRASCRGRG